MRTPFSTMVTLRLDELKLTAEAMAKAVGRSKSAGHGWINANEWPDYEFEGVCRFLRLDFTTKTEAEERYGIKWRRGYGAGREAQIGDVLRPLEPRPLKAASPEALVAKVFGSQDRKHFTAITTQTILPAPYRPVHCPCIVASVYAAMDAGALFAFVVPSRTRVDWLAGLGYSHLVTYEAFQRGHAALVAGYAARLEAAGKDGNSAGLSAQLFTCDAFPMTPCGRTVTLIGEEVGIDNVHMRVLERGPGSNGMIALVPENQTNEMRMRQYVRYAMEAALVAEPPDAQRQRFVDEMTRRMFGRPE